jgi:hypothetical protein
MDYSSDFLRQLRADILDVADTMDDEGKEASANVLKKAAKIITRLIAECAE